ncbi:Alpha/Beta hydrolase protein [Xylaria palmicola]|nr:Alpha/Beta hydrolase protein [Xylaria palmicola]
MLPRPCLSFTLPSIYDNTRLDCRVYHPPCLRDPSHADAPWPRHAAVVAHPYAPLGGCFDDPVVDVVAGTLLQVGFLVATFNFRGAASSESRTSWTSRAEQADYMSVVGFLAYYVHHLDAVRPPPRPRNRHQPPTLLLAGYSYGAMITTRLPPLDAILAYFATPAVHTAEADIRLRAQHLAEAREAHLADPASPRRSLGVRVGGDEGGGPRRSRDAHHQRHESQREDRIRESVRHLLARARLVYGRSPHWSGAGEPEDRMDQCLEGVEGGVAFQAAYLAVSPPVGLVTRLATLSLADALLPSWLGRPRPDESGAAPADDSLLSSNPTLVIYGDQDGFISYRKMRQWTQQLAGRGASRFRYVQVAGAGHFWAEGDVIYRLRDAVGTFATEVTR